MPSEEIDEISKIPTRLEEMSDRPDPPVEGHGQLREQAALLRGQFEDLVKKYCPKLPTQPMTIPQSTPINQVKLKKDSLAQLTSTLLPLLRQNLDKLAFEFEFEPSGSQMSEAKIKTILAIQSELGSTLDRSIFAKHIICLPESKSVSMNNDQDLKELKIYRISILQDKLESLLRSHLRLHFMEYMTICDNLSTTELCLYREFKERSNRFFFDAIDSTIRSIQGSDFHLILDEWSRWITSPGDILGKMMSFDGSRFKPQYMGYNILAVVRAAIPLVKLSRIFFSKLSKHLLNTNNSSRFTEMSSQQLQTLRLLPARIYLYFDDFLYELYKVTPSITTLAYHYIPKTQKVLSDFESSLHIIRCLLAPVIRGNDLFAAQNLSETWLDMWKTQLRRANYTMVEQQRAVGYY